MPFMTKSIHDFQDEHGRITEWPSDRRTAHQQAILHYLRGLFETGQGYSEAEVMQILGDHSTLEDNSVLLNELLDGDYLGTDGGVYWRADGRPVAPGARGNV